MRHLITTACGYGNQTLGLFVDQANTRAQRFYEFFGFFALPGIIQKMYIRMAMDLTSEFIRNASLPLEVANFRNWDS